MNEIAPDEPKTTSNHNLFQGQMTASNRWLLGLTLKSLPQNLFDLQLAKLLTIGASGLVGSKVAVLSSNYGFESYNTTNARTTSLPRTTHLEITNRAATMRLVKEVQPSVIINSAALTNVDYCETHPEEAQRINVEGVRNLVDAARGRNIRIIQISTDYVFDGAVGPYSEEDRPRPINQYGQTKLESEKIVAELGSYAIARPSVIYGWNPPRPNGIAAQSMKPMNFAMFVVDKLRKGERVTAIRDQYSSPTFADNLAEALLRLARFQESGIFHTAGKSCINRYQFATKIAEIFEYPSELVQPVLSRDFKQLAKRPTNTCLRVDKAEKILGMRFLASEEGLLEMRRTEPFS